MLPLSPRGIQEARNAGEKLRPYRFDRAFTSVLQRANETLRLALEVIGQTDSDRTGQGVERTHVR